MPQIKNIQYSTASTGGTIIVTDTSDDIQVIHEDTVLTAVLTLTLPATPQDAQKVFFVSINGVTSLTMTTPVGSILNPTTVLVPNSGMCYIYREASTSWYKMSDPTVSSVPESSITFTDVVTGNFSTTKHGFVPKGTNTGKFLKDDGTWASPSGSGDMVLADVQTVTGLKTFDKDKIATKGTSTGVTTISTANTSATDYVATLQAATGTIAYLSDITGSVSVSGNATLDFGFNAAAGASTVGGFRFTGLSLAVNNTNKYSWKIVTPTYATNPTNVITEVRSLFN